MPHLFFVDLIPFFIFVVGISLLRLGESGSCTWVTLLLGLNTLKLFVYWYRFFYINGTMTFEFWHIYVFTLEVSYLRKAFFHFFKNVILMVFVKYIASPYLITEHVYTLKLFTYFCDRLLRSWKLCWHDISTCHKNPIFIVSFIKLHCFAKT